MVSARSGTDETEWEQQQRGKGAFGGDVENYQRQKLHALLSPLRIRKTKRKRKEAQK